MVAYHPDLEIDGAQFSFAHLAPYRLVLRVDRLARDLAIDVRYSNHCFSEAFDPALHPRSWLVLDGSRERAFSRRRYNLSFSLPGMVADLPSRAVWVTAWERNFLYYVVLADGTDAYPMFFHLKKGGHRDEQLRMFVESAYSMPLPRLAALLKASQKVRFPVLCARIFQGQPLRFKARR